MIFIYQYYYCAPINDFINYTRPCSHSNSRSYSRKFVMSADGKGYVRMKDIIRLNSFCYSRSQNYWSNKLLTRIESKAKKHDAV